MTMNQMNLWTIRDVPVIHPVPGKCRISHYSVLPRPGKIMGPSNKKNFFLLFITVSNKSYEIVDKNILCQIRNIQSYKLVFCVQYFLIFGSFRVKSTRSPDMTITDLNDFW